MAIRLHTAIEALNKADKKFAKVASGFKIIGQALNFDGLIGQFDFGREDKTMPFQRLSPLMDYAQDLIHNDLFDLPYKFMYAATEFYGANNSRWFDDCFVWSLSDDGAFLNVCNVGLTPRTHQAIYGGVVCCDLKTGKIISKDIVVEGFSPEEHASFMCQRPLCFTALLSSPSVELVTTKAPKFLNRKREKAGRPLVGDIHEVRIMLDGKRYMASGESDGSHSSKRAHWRRGHIRRLASGNLTNVRPCLVAFTGNENVPKQVYKVTA